MTKSLTEKHEILSPDENIIHELGKENKKLQEQNADLSQKVHILNEANEKNYNALCDEIKKNNKLQEQLDEAKTENNNLLNDLVDLNLTIQHKEEQISEANKLILWCARISWTGDQREDIFDKYLAKWGVK